MTTQYENYEKILASIANDIQSINVNIRKEKGNAPNLIAKCKDFLIKKKYKIKLLTQRVQILSALIKVLLKSKLKRWLPMDHKEKEFIPSKDYNTLIIEKCMRKATECSKISNGVNIYCHRINSDLENMREKYISSEEKNRYLKNKLSILDNQLKFLYEENKRLRFQIFYTGQDDPFLNKMKGDNIYNADNLNTRQLITSESIRITDNSQIFKTTFRKLRAHLSLVNFLLSSQKQILYDAQEFSKSKLSAS